MTIYIVLSIIALGVVLIIVAAHKLKKVAPKYDAFFTQLKFIQLYMGDTTEKQFYNKTLEEATELGQDMLWRNARIFHRKMQEAVIEQKPISVDDYQLLDASIKIIKAAESLVFIQDNGIIIDDSNVS